MNGATVLTKFTADTKDADSKTNSLESKIKGLTGSIVKSEIVTKALASAWNMVTSSMDGAIKRVDTLNNFPKVMSNLGIGAEESQEAIDLLSDKLTGLPTSLNDAASSVQRFTSKNGDVKESSEMFLALNNAILAGGAPALQQASALEQISQAYAKGKPDMMEWRTMMAAMPAQLNQVAQAMGLVGSSELGEALRDGTISMDEFMQQIMKLNKEGTGEFLSFEEQAKNSTGGIQTAITTMKTAVTRGLGNLINTVNDSLETFGGIGGVLGNVGKGMESLIGGIGSTLATILPQVIPMVSQVFTTLGNTMQSIMPTLTNIMNQILPVITDLINMLLPPIMEIVNQVLPLIVNLLPPIVSLLKPIVAILKPIIDVLMAIITPLLEILNAILPPLIDIISVQLGNTLDIIGQGLTATANILTSVFGAAWEGLKPVINNVKGILEGITNFIKGVFTGNWKQAWNGVTSIFSNVFGGIVNLAKAPLNGAIDLINRFLSKLNGIKIPDWVPGVGGKSFNIGKIPKLNVGTNYVPEDTLAIIHEGEAVIPKEFNPYAGNISPTTLGNMAAGAGSNITVNVEANFEMDPLGQVVKNIKTFSGGAKNDYNYGFGG